PEVDTPEDLAPVTPQLQTPRQQVFLGQGAGLALRPRRSLSPNRRCTMRFRFNSWLRRHFGKAAGRRGPTRRCSTLWVEPLEDRCTPAVITVTGDGDVVAVDGKVTLREAIQSANNNANVNADVVAVGAYGNDKIQFNIGNAAQTITVGTFNKNPLP